MATFMQQNTMFSLQQMTETLVTNGMLTAMRSCRGHGLFGRRDQRKWMQYGQETSITYSGDCCSSKVSG